MRITDHAVLRYLERVDDIDVEGVRQRMAQDLNTTKARRLIDFAGSGRTPFRLKQNGLTYCFKGGILVTCYPTKSLRN